MAPPDDALLPVNVQRVAFNAELICAMETHQQSIEYIIYKGKFLSFAIMFVTENDHD